MEDGEELVLSAGPTGRVVRHRGRPLESLSATPPWTLGVSAGTLVVAGPWGSAQVDPREAARGAVPDLRFGRDTEAVDVEVGIDDPAVSRVHGRFHRRGGRWFLRNTGRRPLRMGPHVIGPGGEVAVPSGYAPVFVEADGRDHLVEVLVIEAGQLRVPAPGDLTRAPAHWYLTARERLVVVALAERYLRHEQHPQPCSWSAVTARLAECDPDAAWTAKQAEYVVHRLRQRLSAEGVPGLSRDEVGEPIGNTLNHNLIAELMTTGAVTPVDLRVLA